MMRFPLAWLLLVLMAGCAQVPVPPGKPQPCVPQPVAPLPVQPHLQPAQWADLPGWQADNLREVWPLWQQECSVMQHKQAWQAACQAAAAIYPADSATVRQYFEQWFSVWQSLQPDGSGTGLITGYYTPLLHGSLSRQHGFSVPLYARPPDLLTVELSSVYPELKGMRLRGRLVGNTVVPYYDRAAIDGATHPLAGHELVWVDDPVEAFFLQIQGSGEVQLPDGRQLTIGYADQNGYPYQAIGRVLVERGDLSADHLSMQAIREWARLHPAQVAEVLDRNPSYVFFRFLPNHQPLGALGLPVTGWRSLAVDPRAIPLGAPVWIATAHPGNGAPLQQLMLAQDTGGAIRGNVRADFYFGVGTQAGEEAGRMKQQGSLWVLLPKENPGQAATR